MTESVEPQPEILPGRKAAGANAIWLVFERVAHLAVAFLVTIVVARQLGPADYGRLAVALSLLILMIPIANVAVQCLVRDVVTEPDAANKLYAAAILASGLLTSMIVLVVAAVVAFTVGFGSDTGIVTIVVVGSALIRPLGVVDAWFQIRLISRRAVLIRVAALVVTGAVRVALPLAGAGVLAVAWTYVAEAVLSSTGVWLAYRRGEHAYRWEVNAGTVRRLLGELAPLLLASSSAVIFTRLDQVMLASLSSLSEAGVFAVASGLAETPRFPLLAVMLSTAPRLLALKKSDPDRYWAELGQLVRMLVLAGYALTLGLIFVMAPLAPVLLGPGYSDTRKVIIILAMTQPLYCVGIVLLFVTNWDRLYREVIVRNLVAAAISISLNLVLLPRYGAVGAAITTVVATTWVHLIGASTARRTRPCFWLTLPALEPVSSVRLLIAQRRRSRRTDAEPPEPAA